MSVTLTDEQADEMMRVVRNSMLHERNCHAGGPFVRVYEGECQALLTLLGKRDPALGQWEFAYEGPFDEEAEPWLNLLRGKLIRAYRRVQQ